MRKTKSVWVRQGAGQDFPWRRRSQVGRAQWGQHLPPAGSRAGWQSDLSGRDLVGVGSKFGCRGAGGGACIKGAGLQTGRGAS